MFIIMHVMFNFINEFTREYKCFLSPLTKYHELADINFL